MASGDTLAIFTALTATPGDADFATPDVILSASADEPDQLFHVLDFDPGATLEFAYLVGIMPRNYGGNGIDATIIWSSDATSGTCVWNLAFKSFTDDADDIDSKAFAAPQAVTATTASAAGELDYALIQFTDGAQMDSVAAGEFFALELSRNQGSMSSNDAEFHALELRETP